MARSRRPHSRAGRRRRNRTTRARVEGEGIGRPQGGIAATPRPRRGIRPAATPRPRRGIASGGRSRRDAGRFYANASGLGNQIFQYAHGFLLAKSLGYAFEAMPTGPLEQSRRGRRSPHDGVGAEAFDLLFPARSGRGGGGRCAAPGATWNATRAAPGVFAGTGPVAVVSERKLDLRGAARDSSGLTLCRESRRRRDPFPRADPVPQAGPTAPRDARRRVAARRGVHSHDRLLARGHAAPRGSRGTSRRAGAPD